ncbi:MAG: bifunctional phosphoserine phosphatase/homoserine phosphotransferase ThrH [Candidatus Omnitrophica bacterium]|nr:bifunctional phosphoserine phosphatase/homoserine phosphotransferase ThrH [Candidatus Omnitrophota bacterium]
MGSSVAASTRTRVICLDLEGVLVPEIWIAVAEKTRISDLKRTTRDEPDYDKLMRFRIGILKKAGIRLADIQKVIASMGPLPGAAKFVSGVRAKFQLIILSDTFGQFAAPLMKQLGWPTIFCNSLEVDESGFIVRHVMRQTNGKEHAVRALQKLNFAVHAAGDSFNDLTMIQAADKGVFFCPPASIASRFPKIPVCRTYAQLAKAIVS